MKTSPILSLMDRPENIFTRSQIASDEIIHNGGTISDLLALDANIYLVFVFLTLAATTPQPALSQSRTAEAVVRIVVPAHSSKEHWDSTPQSRRKEIILDDGHGQKTRVRLIEFE